MKIDLGCPKKVKIQKCNYGWVTLFIRIQVFKVLVQDHTSTNNWNSHSLQIGQLISEPFNLSLSVSESIGGENMMGNTCNKLVKQFNINHFMMNQLSPSWSGNVSCLLTIQLQTSELLAVKLLEITASHMKAAAILSLF